MSSSNQDANYLKQQIKYLTDLIQNATEEKHSSCSSYTTHSSRSNRHNTKQNYHNECTWKFPKSSKWVAKSNKDSNRKPEIPFTKVNSCRSSNASGSLSVTSAAAISIPSKKCDSSSIPVASFSDKTITNQSSSVSFGKSVATGVNVKTVPKFASSKPQTSSSLPPSLPQGAKTPNSHLRNETSTKCLSSGFTESIPVSVSENKSSKYVWTKKEEKKAKTQTMPVSQKLFKEEPAGKVVLPCSVQENQATSLSDRIENPEGSFADGERNRSQDAKIKAIPVPYDFLAENKTSHSLDAAKSELKKKPLSLKPSFIQSLVQSKKAQREKSQDQSLPKCQSTVFAHSSLEERQKKFEVVSESQLFSSKTEEKFSNCVNKTKDLDDGPKTQHQDVECTNKTYSNEMNVCKTEGKCAQMSSPKKLLTRKETVEELNKQLEAAETQILKMKKNISNQQITMKSIADFRKSKGSLYNHSSQSGLTKTSGRSSLPGNINKDTNAKIVDRGPVNKNVLNNNFPKKIDKAEFILKKYSLRRKSYGSRKKENDRKNSLSTKVLGSISHFKVQKGYITPSKTQTLAKEIQSKYKISKFAHGQSLNVTASYNSVAVPESNHLSLKVLSRSRYKLVMGLRPKGAYSGKRKYGEKHSSKYSRQFLYQQSTKPFDNFSKYQTNKTTHSAMHWSSKKSFKRKSSLSQQTRYTWRSDSFRIQKKEKYKYAKWNVNTRNRYKKINTKRLSSDALKSKHTQNVASRVLQKSIATAMVAKYRKVNTLKSQRGKQFCMFFNRFGQCNRGDNCPYIHDPEKVAVCTRYLRGTCKVSGCPFSHNVSKEKMPVCSHFLRGSCSREECPYLHVKVNKNAAVCQNFLKGFCSLGSKCRQKHVLVCPEFSRKGSCAEGKKCPLLHQTRKRKMSSTPSALSEGNRIEESHKPLEEEEETDDVDVPFRKRKLPVYISVSTAETIQENLPATIKKENTELKIRPVF